MQRNIPFFSALFILLVSFLSYQPSFIGSYYQLDSGEFISSYDDYEVGALLLYDVNGDGNINERDRISLLKTLDGWKESGARTDIDRDGTTTEEDLRLLEEYLERKNSASSLRLKDGCVPGQILCTSSRTDFVSGDHTTRRNQPTTYKSCAYDSSTRSYQWGSALSSCPKDYVCSSIRSVEKISSEKEAVTLLSSCIPSSPLPQPRPSLYRSFLTKT